MLNKSLSNAIVKANQSCASNGRGYLSWLHLRSGGVSSLKPVELMWLLQQFRADIDEVATSH